MVIGVTVSACDRLDWLSIATAPPFLRILIWPTSDRNLAW
jgi:hypothetical protein